MENKKDNEGLIKLLCYLGIFVLLLFIILPPLFRMVFPEEEHQDEEQQKLIMNLTCVKIEDFIDYKIKTTINTNYIEERISNSIFTYEIEYMDDIFGSEDIIIEEYETLKRVNNVDFDEDGNKYTLTIDYVNFDYSNEAALINHKMMIGDQLSFYGSQQYECNTSKVQ